MASRVSNMSGNDEHISNYSLHAEMMVLKSRLESHGDQVNNHVKEAAAFRGEMTSSVAEITRRLGDGNTRFAVIEDKIQNNTNTLSDINKKLDGLVESENKRKGRDDLLSQIWNSSVIRWMLGILTTAGAFFWGRDGGGLP